MSYQGLEDVEWLIWTVDCRVDDDDQSVNSSSSSSSVVRRLFVSCKANDNGYQTPYLVVNTVSISSFMVGTTCRP